MSEKRLCEICVQDTIGNLLFPFRAWSRSYTSKLNTPIQRIFTLIFSLGGPSLEHFA